MIFIWKEYPEYTVELPIGTAIKGLIHKGYRPSSVILNTKDLRDLQTARVEQMFNYIHMLYNVLRRDIG
jgi:hypothetical protein